MKRRITAVLVLAALLAGYAIVLRTARAQESIDRSAIDLSRVCIGEAGWNVAQTGECAAINEAIENRAIARRSDFAETLRAYSGGHFEAVGRRPWIAELNARGAQPIGWPSAMRWSRYAPRWLETIAHAAKVRRGEVAVPCAEPVDHWAAPTSAMDRHARGAGLIRVECAPAVLNHFWRVPRRSRS